MQEERALQGVEVQAKARTDGARWIRIDALHEAVSHKWPDEELADLLNSLASTAVVAGRHLSSMNRQLVSIIVRCDAVCPSGVPRPADLAVAGLHGDSIGHGLQ